MNEGLNGGRAQAYQALRESEELHRLTLGNISDAVFITDDNGVFTFICPNVDVIFGYVPDEVRAMGKIDSLLGENLYDRGELAARGEIHNLEREIKSKSGERRTVLIHVKAVSIKTGTVLYTCRDVTERKLAEEKLRVARIDLAHASRLALVGELMASITHEISQPLTAIAGNAGAGIRLVSVEPVDLTVLGDLFNDIRDQAHVATSVIERLRALVRKRPLAFVPIDVNEIVNDVLRLIESDAGRRSVSIHSELAASIPLVNADRVSLTQVVLNLCLNAMDAVDTPEHRERRMTVRTQYQEEKVTVAVIDSGGGISPDRMAQLFDAFYTTKTDGIGLGLAIARSIVEMHNGRIWAESEAGRGATFRMTLPALPGLPPAGERL